jgi:putative ABC transport system ATP-binding protein
MLVVRDLVKTFNTGSGAVTATDKVSFDVPDGQFASIVGRSGSGKSTLLSLLGGLDKPTSGSIMVGDRDLAKFNDHELIGYRGRAIGFVFQSYNLVPNLSALENVMLPMEFAKVGKSERIERATQLLQQVSLEDDQMQRRPSHLSGGQQQRVAIARALANHPKLILADEPTGNLDSETGKMIFDLLHDLSKSERTTIIVVTHDSEIAGKTDRVFRLQDGKLTKEKK